MGEGEAGSAVGAALIERLSQGGCFQPGRVPAHGEAAGPALPEPAAASPPKLSRSVDVRAFDQERDPYVGAPLVEVLAAQSG